MNLKMNKITNCLVVTCIPCPTPYPHKESPFGCANCGMLDWLHAFNTEEECNDAYKKEYSEEFDKDGNFIMTQREIIRHRMAELSYGIDEFDIGDIVYDTNGNDYKVSDKSRNSIELYIKKKINEGINCKQWFTIKDFIKKFKK